MEHSIEPELLSPVPRKTRPREESLASGALLYRFGMVLLIGVGIGLFVFFCLQLVMGITAPANGVVRGFRAGADQPAPQGSSGPNLPAGSGGGTPSQRTSIMDYTFRVDGRDYQGSAQIPPAQIELMQQDTPIRVRYVPFFPDQMNRPALPNDLFWGSVGMVGLITLVAELLIGTLCWFTFALPNRQQELCRTGKAGIATVMRKEVWGAGANGYVVHYRFEPEPERPKPGASDEKSAKPGAEVLGEMRVPQAFYEEVDDGDKLTVLYSPSDPQSSVLYKPSMFAVVPATYADRRTG
ncbi:MAG TPA: DUF3592 domain-containing protein [Chthonomonadaceae bacterium]|nr:DUF3592 domain-containing protein [Chthonomonadaceae bacterium]